MSSPCIYLYVKQHTKTGLKYFGKTTKPNPYQYKGSGRKWLRHINKNGRKYVITLKVWEFTDIKQAQQFARQFSVDNNIVESLEWANLIEENGLDGAPAGSITSLSTKQKISKANGSSVTICGVDYPSISQAARQLFPDVDVSVGRIKVKRLQSGDSIVQNNSKMIEINGTIYPSYGKAAKALGVDRSTIRRKFG